MDAKSGQPIAQSPGRTADEPEPSRYVVAKRIVLVTGAAVVALNVWTGAPLLALVVGSKVQGNSHLSMGTVFAVIIVFAILEFLLAWALSWLNATYDRVTGRAVEARRTSPWLRSMRGESEEDTRARYSISPIERIVSLSVAGAILLFEVWFFFFAGSSLGPGT
jgi:hypothetical protein